MRAFLAASMPGAASSASSSPSSSSLILPLMPEMRNRRSPMSCTELWRMRHDSSNRPCSSSGSKRSIALVLWLATIMRPARIDASRTKSESSARPDRTGWMILPRYGEKRSPNVTGRKTRSEMWPSRMKTRGLDRFWRMVGNSSSRRSTPRPARTSETPCAAPCWSTWAAGDLRTAMSDSMRSGKLFSPRRSTRPPSDLAAVERASGTGSTRTSRRSGTSWLR